MSASGKLSLAFRLSGDLSHLSPLRLVQLSKYIFEYGILPIVFLAFKFVAETDRETQSELWAWIQTLLSWIFSALWILPIFLLSRIVNIFFFQEIADSSFRGRTQQLNSISKLVADYFFSLFVQIVFLVQTMSFTYFPVNYLNQILGVLHLSLLYSMYSFEYKWFNMGRLPTQDRLIAQLAFLTNALLSSRLGTA